MFYTGRNWKDRAVATPDLLRLTDQLTGESRVYSYVKVEGAIQEPGDEVDAANANEFDYRVKMGFDNAEVYIDEKYDELLKYTNAQISATDTKLTNAINSSASATAQNAKPIIKTATITNSGWTSASGYYQKTTTLTLPTGHDGNCVDLYMDDTIQNLASTIWAVNVSGTIYVRTKTVPNGNINIRLVFKQTRSS